MRTTVRLPDALLNRAKSYARARNCTFTDLVKESLEEKINGQPPNTRRVPPPLPVAKGGGICFVNGMTYAEVLDFLDEGVPFEKLR